jgi:hypothetical protein
MIQRRERVSQVSKTSSSSGMYLCSIQVNACERWTLGVVFPPGYRVSNCEEYRQGSAWLRMQTAWAMVYNAKREPTKGSVLQAMA